MRAHVVALIAGLLFAIGLGISGMTSQGKVLGFLDLTGAWDPSLLMVMVAAVTVHGVGHRIAQRRTRPFLSDRYDLPTERGILDPKLLFGATLFGVGWGLGGFCPGPALVSVVTGAPSTLVFVASMTIGMVVQHLIFNDRAQRSLPSA